MKDVEKVFPILNLPKERNVKNYLPGYEFELYVA